MTDTLMPVARLQRIRTRAQFQVALAGSPVAKTAHFALHAASLDVAPRAVPGRSEGPLFPVLAPWVGVVLPKRWAKRAVTRNALRRQIYEVARQHAQALPARALVVRLRSAFDRQQFISASSPALKRCARSELQQLLTQFLGNARHA